jgi:hypothetical protein
VFDAATLKKIEDFEVKIVEEEENQGETAT